MHYRKIGSNPLKYSENLLPLLLLGITDDDSSVSAECLELVDMVGSAYCKELDDQKASEVCLFANCFFLLLVNYVLLIVL